MSADGWIAVDLDGTLAHYTQWKGVDHVGAPIKPMLARVIEWVNAKQKVKIFTARVGPQRDQAEREAARKAIQRWCLEHIGEVLEVTHEKDFGMTVLYDDRCVQVEKNTGRLITGCGHCNP